MQRLAEQQILRKLGKFCFMPEPSDFQNLEVTNKPMIWLLYKIQQKFAVAVFRHFSWRITGHLKIKIDFKLYKESLKD